MDNKKEKTTKAIVLKTMPENLLAIAVEKGAGIEQLEKLMDLQERWQKQVAKKAYYEAMSEFQDICPPLKKTGKVDYKTKVGDRVNYNHSELDYIAEQIKSSMRQCGFSYRWETEDVEGGKIKTTCIVTHIEGHSESNYMVAPKDDSGKKNPLQAIGSTRSYENRYTLAGVLGLTFSGEDDDGQGGKKDFTEDIKKEITEKLKSIKDKEKLNELNSKYKQFHNNTDYQKLLMGKQAEIKKQTAFDKAQSEEFVKQTIEGVNSEPELKVVLKENGDIMTNETLKKLYNKKLNSFKDEKAN